MKRIGIDFGSKKIGLAVTDDAGMMAFPHAVVPNDKQFMTYLEDLVEERRIEEIVVGHSLDNQGQPNVIHKAVEAFITDATLKLGLPIHLEPEQYSTQEAKHIQGKGDMTDASAATLILNSFISKQK